MKTGRTELGVGWLGRQLQGDSGGGEGETGSRPGDTGLVLARRGGAKRGRREGEAGEPGWGWRRTGWLDLPGSQYPVGVRKAKRRECLHV